MAILSFLSRASRTYKGYPKLLVLCTLSLSSGGLVAYSESQPDTRAPHVDPNEKEPKKKRVVVLGTGWAGTSLLKDLDASLYDIQVVSPRNYFAFTPLLPSVTCGTVEARSIVEPIRNIVKKRKGEVKIWEAECVKIDAANNKILCRSNIENNLVGNREFFLEYDYLVIGVGAQVNTFNTPGVKENCHFLKEVEDAQKIRRSVIDCFETAILPGLSEEEQRTNLHFIIVGGGPTGVEFAAELHDFLEEDLVKLYPAVKDLVRITVIQSGDHILNTFDERISSFAETKFRRDGIEVQTGCRVLSVSDKDITMKVKSKEEVCTVPHGLVVWSTGIATRPVVRDFMEQVGQAKRRVLETDEWLRVKGCENVYAIGDCATIDQRKVMEDILSIFEAADKDNSGTLTVEEFKDVVDDILIRYPQVDHYLKSQRHLRDVTDLLKDPQGNDWQEVNVEQFKLALSHVDSQMKSLPATAQVAAQQGAYLSRCFNHIIQCEENPEGPRRFRGSGRHRFRPFQYKHFGQFAPLGGEQAAAELPGDWVSIGHSTQWLWYSVYASKQVSWRTRILVVSDWTRRFIFGRDSSRI
ncbi:external alternative NAD(P)H-ubiquinone oxidoreductase B1, mitochondrial-like [Quercus robur]|uniref:external alternative NAD(P)H-ubiquinone oxidoreductase B1, mitochondrial-like n=1 Tax=Quercus robur TaxID=38942 RepID=UPI00216246AA|nr:external alternative NAD(P)H-ubiquinone oxidoreductase B1, mitochondrial-like [Quercus robur]